MAKARICFLVGSVAMSGGPSVILQHASFLRDQGHDVTLAVQEPFGPETLAWHDEGPKLRCVSFDEARRGTYDVAIGTWWRTALDLATFDARHHAYFVQSIESRFYPEHEKALHALVDATYAFPVHFVTEATWIVHHLAAHFGKEARLVRNGIRKDIYTPDGPVVAPRPRSGQPRILVEGHFCVPFKNTALAVKLAREAGARDVWVMTGSRVTSLPGVSRVFSRVPIQTTAEVYRSCDVLLKLSTVEGMFGPPLEMFHCGGTAVVFDVTGHDEYIRAGENALVAEGRDVERVVAQIRALCDDRARLDSLKAGALATAAAWPAWAQSSAEFERWVIGVSSSATSSPANRKRIEELAARAWDRYKTDEARRRRRDPRALVRIKLAELVSRLPGAVREQITRVQTLSEVLSPSRLVS